MKKLRLLILVTTILVSACTSITFAPIPTQIPSTSIPVEQDPTATSTPLPTQTPTNTAPAPTLEPTIAQPTSPPTATQTPYAAGPDNFSATTDPLTGLVVSDPNLLNRRPVAVKVQLYPRGQRPVFGVSLADIVFDYYQNDGLTRLNAIFYGNNAEKIGPIRSARLFDESIIRMYKALFAFGGASRYVLDRFYSAEYANRLITERNRNCPPMCRVDPNGFNFLMTNSSELSAYAQQKKVDNSRQNLDGMSFNAEAPAGGQPGTQLTTHYSISAYSRWDYDPNSGRYVRSQDNAEAHTTQDEAYAPLIDGLTNEQIAADNVVVLFLPHQPANYTSSKEALDIQLTGSGEAIAFRDGQAYKVLWNRPAKDSTLFLTTEDGKPFPYKPGNTWYQVVGLSSQVENPSVGVWGINSKNP